MMMNLDRKPLPERVRFARLQLGLTQRDVAKSILAKQNAISAFEHGQLTALSAEKIAKLCQLLEVKLPTVQAGHVEDFSQTANTVIAVCPNAHCESNEVLQRGDQYIAKPKHVSVLAGRDWYCKQCGETLLTQCPNCECEKPLASDAAFCTYCGTPYVVVLEKKLKDITSRGT